jgi:hypothetical protein
LPVFDERGEPAHRPGITAIPGLCLLGLQWLYKRKSSFVYGLEEDAAYLPEQIAARACMEMGSVQGLWTWVMYYLPEGV